MTDWSQFPKEQLQELIKSLRNDTLRTEQQMRQIQEELDKRDQKECEKFVGRCYRDSDKYFRISGVPQFKLTMTYSMYSPNQIPATIVEINSKTMDGIYEDIIYRTSIDEAYRQAHSYGMSFDVAEEITEAEFEEFLLEKVRRAGARIAAAEVPVNQ